MECGWEPWFWHELPGWISHGAGTETIVLQGLYLAEGRCWGSRPTGLRPQGSDSTSLVPALENLAELDGLGL